MAVRRLQQLAALGVPARGPPIIHEAPDFAAHPLSATATDLLQGLLQKDPEQRTRFAGLAGHPFVAGVDWDAAAKLKVPLPSLPDAEGLSCAR